MLIQALQGSLSGDNGRDEEPEGGEHGKASVLDLLHLELSEGLWVISQAQGIKESTSGVQLVQVLTEATFENKQVIT